MIFFRFSGDSVEPEALNKKALDIVHRVRDKLTGRDFNKEVSSRLQTPVLVSHSSIVCFKIIYIEYFDDLLPRQAIRIRTTITNPLMHSGRVILVVPIPTGPGSKTFVQLRILSMG